MSEVVPTIDLSGWADGDDAARAEIAAAVDRGAREVGFLQIFGHGIDPDLVERMLAAVDRLFELPMATKMQYLPVSPDVNNGYSPVGAESLAYSLGVDDAPPDLFEAFMAGVPGNVIVVVDEAYAEFADAPDYASALPLVARFPNLVVTRTFSKAHALAGLRVGFAVAHPDLIAVMERVRESFNVNALALAAAEASLADAAHLAASVAGNRQQRQVLADALRGRGLAVSPSQTNFLLVEFGDAAGRIEAALVARGVVLRPMGGYGLGDCLRITVGTEEENARLLAALDEALA